MRALVKTAVGQGNLEVRDVPVPQAGADEVLVRVRACGICGSDLKLQDDQHPYTPPVVIGHEFAGEIVEVGADVLNWKIGDRVVAELHANALPPMFDGQCICM
jgi:L-iditol 2-dehydrogenase